VLTRASNGYLRHGLCLLVLRDECSMPSAHGHLQAHPLGMVFPIEYLSCPLLQRNHHVDGYITTLITCKSGVFRSPRSLRASSCRSSASATRETSVSSPARTKGEGNIQPAGSKAMVDLRPRPHPCCPCAIIIRNAKPTRRPLHHCHSTRRSNG